MNNRFPRPPVLPMTTRIKLHGLGSPKTASFNVGDRVHYKKHSSWWHDRIIGIKHYNILGYHRIYYRVEYTTDMSYIFSEKALTEMQEEHSRSHGAKEAQIVKVKRHCFTKTEGRWK